MTGLFSLRQTFERSYTGLRLAGAIAKRPDELVRVFLLGHAAACAKSGQATPSSLEELADWVLWANQVLVF
jgi:sulfur relay (sulfurtransferase) complex TusBCD TusD component (DsrE family)